jgi:hypothetical protein
MTLPCLSLISIPFNRYAALIVSTQPIELRRYFWATHSKINFYNLLIQKNGHFCAPFTTRSSIELYMKKVIALFGELERYFWVTHLKNEFSLRDKHGCAPRMQEGERQRGEPTQLQFG